MAKRARTAAQAIELEGASSSTTNEADFERFARLGTIAGYPIVATIVSGALSSIDFEEIQGADYVEAPSWLEGPFVRYLAGEPETFEDVPLVLSGTNFQMRVWRELRRIPWGRLASYAEVAERVQVPRGMRAVGAANGANPIPIVVPCHRVVEGGGKLGGYSGGLDVKRSLLAREGARFVRDHVHMGQLSLFGTTD